MDHVSSIINIFILLIYYIYISNNLLKFRYTCGLCFNEGKQDTYEFLDPQLFKHLETRSQKHKHTSPLP